MLAALSMSAPAAFAAPSAVIVGPSHLAAGAVEPGDLQHYKFTLRNDGDAPLAIEAIEPTCYCTSAKTDAWEVAPGATTTIHVTVDPSDFVGMVTKGVEILTNDPKNPKQRVDVDLDIRPGIAVVPPEIDFGNVPPTGSKRFQVDLKAARTRPFKVRAATSSVHFVTVEPEPLELEERAGTRLIVRAQPGAPPGAFVAKITVETDDAARPRIEIPVRGVGAGGIAVDPARLMFESAAPGADLGAIAVSGKAMRITGVRTTSPLIEATLQAVADGTYNVKVKVAAAAKPGRVMAKVLVATTDAGQPELTIPVMGLVR
jgi:hypothetical protein